MQKKEEVYHVKKKTITQDNVCRRHILQARSIIVDIEAVWKTAKKDIPQLKKKTNQKYLVYNIFFCFS